MYKEVKSCRVCHSVNLKKYLDLGEQPLANSLGDNPEKYPLQVLFCEECCLSQLSIVVNPDILYKDYPYHSSISKTFQKHCREMAIEVKKYFTESAPFVLDIASNDGCLLQEFKRQGFATLGIEPASNLAAEANSNGINTISGYWCKETAGKAPNCDVITATNVFAHVDDIHSFLTAVKESLRVYTNGIFVMEVPYLPKLIEGNQFDTIYHEHLSYFLLKPLDRIFNECGLQIFRVDEKDIHGGSIRVYASPFSREIENSVIKRLEDEHNHGYYRFSTYENFSSNIETVKGEVKTTLRELKKLGKKVMGYGASAKGCNLLNICGIEKDELISVVDETPAKQGKTVPGIGIPIVGFENFDVIEPDFIILLAWNFAKELILKTPHHSERRGHYIVPIPWVRIA